MPQSAQECGAHLPTGTENVAPHPVVREVSETQSALAG